MVAVSEMIAGLGMLVLGRQLYWLFVGGIGFMFGLDIANQYLGEPTDQSVLIMALILGLIAAVFAVFLQQIVLRFIGFFAGGVFLPNLLDLLNLDFGDSYLFLFLIGGVLGLALVMLLFNGALVLFSTIIGATFIVQPLQLEESAAIGVTTVLVIIGILIQSNQLRQEKRIS